MSDDAEHDELPEQYASLPIGEFAFPGELRDRLVAAILAGEKTTTSCLHVEFELEGQEPPTAGHRGVEDWRRGHEDFWHSAQYREAIGRPEFTVDDSTLVVAQRFCLVEDLRGRRSS